jgi:hypothetical protein
MQVWIFLKKQNKNKVSINTSRAESVFGKVEPVNGTSRSVDAVKFRDAKGC